MFLALRFWFELRSSTLWTPCIIRYITRLVWGINNYIRYQSPTEYARECNTRQWFSIYKGHYALRLIGTTRLLRCRQDNIFIRSHKIKLKQLEPVYKTIISKLIVGYVLSCPSNSTIKQIKAGDSRLLYGQSNRLLKMATRIGYSNRLLESKLS